MIRNAAIIESKCVRDTFPGPTGPGVTLTPWCLFWSRTFYGSWKIVANTCTEPSGWSQISPITCSPCELCLNTKKRTFICDHPLEILWPFHRFWSILSLHISMSRGKRGKEWLRTALYTFLALYTICYTSPLLNCYTQYSYHSLWVFIKICLTINAVLVQNNCF